MKLLLSNVPPASMVRSWIAVFASSETVCAFLTIIFELLEIMTKNNSKLAVYDAYEPIRIDNFLIIELYTGIRLTLIL